MDPEYVDTLNIQALYRKSGETWVAVHWVVGATDVWYAWKPLCDERGVGPRRRGSRST